MSDMTGTKARALDDWAVSTGNAMIRFDYSGCGASGGAFADGTISRWTDDATLAARACAGDAPLVLVGSSMGGWIALRLALALGRQIAGLVLVAPAPDFTRWGMTASERATAARDGFVERVSEYGDMPYRYTTKLLADGDMCALLDAPIAVQCPVRILHGQADPDVPWRLSLDVADRLGSPQVQVTLVKDGDHRLSRPADLALLTATVATLIEDIACG